MSVFFLEFFLVFGYNEIMRVKLTIIRRGVLTLTGVLFDPIPFETPIEGADCILIHGRHKAINRSI